MQKSIKRDFQSLSFITIVISMLLLSGFWILYDYRSFQAESARFRTKYMSEYENLLRYQVERVVNEIKYKQSLAEQKRRDEIKERTNEAVTVVKSIYRDKAGIGDEEKVKAVIKNSLRDIRFDNGKGYYFALNVDGTVELHPLDSNLESLPLAEYSMAESEEVVKAMLDIVGSKGEGFYQYDWFKPDVSRKTYPKISYIKYIPELDWVLGAGEYLDDYTTSLQDEICRQVEQIRFGAEKKDYVFIATWDGLGMSFPAKGKNMLETRDANGLYVVKALIEKAKAGGGFVQYVMPALENIEPKPKLSYAAPIPEWEWYVGAGIYIDEIENTIAENVLVFKAKVMKHVEIMLIVLVSLLLIHMLIMNFISRKIWKQIDMFSRFFQRASTEAVSMENELLDYKEFREISRFANDMLDERNRFLEEIRSSRDEWVDTFNAIGDCIMLLDGNGKVLKVNTATVDMLSVDMDEISGKSVAELCGQNNPVISTLQDKLPHTVEMELQNSDTILLASSFPLFSENGEMHRIIHVGRDVTEQKMLEKQLGQTMKMEALGTLAGGIAHDFNNILSAILGYTELAQVETDETSPAQEYLQEVLFASNRARELTRQILAFSRHAEITKVPVQIASITKEALKLLRSSIPSSITIEQQIQDDTGAILADPSHIHQIIMNICTNAYHAMEQTGGILSVSLNRISQTTEVDITVQGESGTGEYAELTIKDNGPGIDPAIKDKIFDPFFTTKETGRGTGMGLAIVHGIVKECGGYIVCRSEPGEGTVFTIGLPLLDEAFMGVETKRPTQAITGTEHILYVDDEKILAEMSRVRLQYLGYTVTICTESHEALEVFGDNPSQFDLVMTDQTMPDMTGMELARKLLQIRPDVPIILCTGFSTLVTADQARTAGIRDFVMKPFEWSEMAENIRKILDDLK